MEVLRTQLDSLRWEKQQLDMENARLREANPGTAALADAEAEATRLQKEAAHLQEEATDELVAPSDSSGSALRRLVVSQHLCKACSPDVHAYVLSTWSLLLKHTNSTI